MQTTLLAHIVVLLLALPMQLGLMAFNGRVQWFTPGELRFWGVAIFIMLEIFYMVWL
jgi:hypothetical protein